MKNKKLIAMDMDGTLTQHKSLLEPQCHKILEQLGKRYDLLMVCAGGCERVYKQLEAFNINILGFYGMQYGQVNNGILKIIENIKVPVNHELIISLGKEIREKFGFDKFKGESIEFHDSGLITFPILGTEAPLEEKLTYDQDRIKRRKYYEEICKIFKNYNVFIGGTSSFDIVPKPYSKFYALSNYLERNDLRVNDAIFFGDDYGIGGNDRCVYESTIQFVKIDSYINFPLIASELLLK